MSKVYRTLRLTVFHSLFFSIMVEYETFNSVYGPIKKNLPRSVIQSAIIPKLTTSPSAQM